MAEPDRVYLSLAQLALRSGLSVRTLRYALAAAEGSLPHYRVGRRVLVRTDEFDTWMQARRVTRSEAEERVRRAFDECDVESRTA